MNKSVNAKVFALKYKLLSVLKASIEKDKKIIKEGGNITYNDYCKITVSVYSKPTYSKDDQAILDEYAKSIGIKKQETICTRVNVSGIPAEVDNKVNEILEIVETISDDATIKRVANAVANIK